MTTQIYQSLHLQNDIYNYPLNDSPWVSTKHLKLNISKIEFLIFFFNPKSAPPSNFPILVSGTTTHPDFCLRSKIGVNLDSSCPLISYIQYHDNPQLSRIIIPTTRYHFPAKTLGQSTIINSRLLKFTLTGLAASTIISFHSTPSSSLATDEASQNYKSSFFYLPHSNPTKRLPTSYSYQNMKVWRTWSGPHLSNFLSYHSTLCRLFLPIPGRRHAHSSLRTLATAIPPVWQCSSSRVLHGYSLVTWNVIFFTIVSPIPETLPDTE